MSVLTLFALFGDDFRIITTDIVNFYCKKSSDTIWFTLFFITFGMFSAEIIATSIAKVKLFIMKERLLFELLFLVRRYINFIDFIGYRVGFRTVISIWRINFTSKYCITGKGRKSIKNWCKSRKDCSNNETYSFSQTLQTCSTSFTGEREETAISS